MLKVQGKVDKLSALSRQYADFSAKKYKKIQNINKSAKKSRRGGKPTPEALFGHLHSVTSFCDLC
ncbi:hypothetical protein IE986_23430 [Klebsiella pneumoniae]|uniref:Uncharacterized protein n=1 Tax=Klebsiella pneumoniae TaxID=573 RepID=A0A927DAP5_KLEPN|nr:hypothetical protein [Klebsiella pneumoniae]